MDFTLPGIPVTVALAAVALIGYLFGRVRRTDAVGELTTVARRELRRASLVAKELEAIAEALRKNLATHHTSVARFQKRLASISTSHPEAVWTELCREAEDVLKPTIRMASQLAQAYDEIRQQTNHLMTFTEVRTDALTGVSNRRALDEALRMLFALLARYDRPFSLAIFDIDHFKQVNDEHGHVYGDGMLRDVARLIDEAVRDTDVVARFGGEEFVVLMPQTELVGATIFADRMRANIQRTVKLTVSGGVAQAAATDDPQSLLGRADVALYGAKAAGRNLVFIHDGDEVSPAAARIPEDALAGGPPAPAKA